ncbi:uncharacterized protein LOC125649625 isoform X2 [Ostrea edulis]|uniref:uncharacterized protein LOC125649625 isoform X2 n=1 Tax=Ostrea edulis TaxID=37623 RepID=UPI0024AF5E9E|nr:uncharacterized protein LOC125649625 isoform X2 [Ostrea edulis]
MNYNILVLIFSFHLKLPVYKHADVKTSQELTSENHSLFIKDMEELWKCLEIVVGTEDEVQMRRDVMEVYQEVKNVAYHTRDYISGSNSEGFNFFWSDLDVLFSCLNLNVVIHCKGCPNTKCAFIATDADCQPGFCKLLPYSYSCSKPVDDGVCVSRIQYLNDRVKNLINKNVDARNDGPCITTNYPTGFDMCPALPIDTISSNQFLRRFRTNFWNNIKSVVLEKNITAIHVVAKGPPEGDIKGIQWLKSFSVLEQHIVHSLNHVQFCCYGLLKILIYFEINICDETHDTLCSYHLKTVLFHVLEDIHSDFWIPSNIFHCLWICLTRLLLFVKKGVCPNYFIPECNLFLKKRVVEKKCKIEEKLLQILQSGAYGVLCYLEFLSVTNPTTLQQNPPTLRKLLALSSALLHVKGHHTTYHECMLSVLKVIHLLANERDNIKIAVLHYLFSLLMRRAGVILYGKYLLYGFTECLLTAEAAFILARHSDASGALYLATLWYCQGKFKHAIKLLAAVLKKLPATSFLNGHVFYTTSLLSDVSKPSCSFTDLMRSYYSRGVELDRGGSFFPKVLENDVRNSIVPEFTMYDKSYTLFLMFLCYREVQQKEKCITSLSKLNKSYTDWRFNCLPGQLQHNSKLLGIIAESKMAELI